MESDSLASAEEQLLLLAASRELALERIVLPWRYIVGLAVVANGCMLPMVLPMLMTGGWALLIQGVFLAAGVVLLMAQSRRQRVKRPRLRVRGLTALTAVGSLTSMAALVVVTYARYQDNAWLGIAALVVNLGAYVVMYGAMSFLLRRQFDRLP